MSNVINTDEIPYETHVHPADSPKGEVLLMMLSLGRKLSWFPVLRDLLEVKTKGEIYIVMAVSKLAFRNGCAGLVE